MILLEVAGRDGPMLQSGSTLINPFPHILDIKSLGIKENLGLHHLDSS